MKRILSLIFQKWCKHRRPDAHKELMENAAFAGELQWDVTQRHERCHNTGNDLMTSNVKPAFGSLYICMFRPSEQSFLRLQLSYSSFSLQPVISVNLFVSADVTG